MKPVIAAAVVAALMLPCGLAANAGSKEALTEYVRKLLDTGDLAQTADDAAIELVNDGKRMKLTGQELKTVAAEQKPLMSDYGLENSR
jgi:hypothetical protein